MVAGIRLILTGFVLFSFLAPARSDDPILPSSQDVIKPKGQVLILVSLPGDEEHERLFPPIVKQWREWLTGKLGFDPAEIHVLYGEKAQPEISSEPISREAIAKEVERVKQTLQPDDRLWVFFLGHANFDGERAWFHLPGPDIDEAELGKLFSGIDCREQIFWLTNMESGRFVKNISAKGRIVIAATRSSNEDNETEFPQAISAMAEKSAEELDIDKDGKLSALELYYRIFVEVQARYNVDKRVPTEHSQLDDNGDGVGTERPLASEEDKNNPAADGNLAHATILPYPAEPKAKAEKAAETAE
jgi:hypothetical protein